MKKFLSLLLTLALMLSLCPAVYAASLPTLSYELSCSGAYLEDGVNEIENLKTGDKITVEFYISAPSAANVYMWQNSVYYDHKFFSLVSGSNQPIDGLCESTVMNTCVNYNTMDKHQFSGKTKVGEMTLQIIGTEGDRTIYSDNAIVIDNKLNEFPVTMLDLHVSIGPKKIPQYTVSYDTKGGESISADTVNKNTPVTLPEPERLYYDFIDWTCSDDGKHYKAGASYTPKKDVTMTANWEAVEVPAAPTGFTVMQSSCPGAADGSISGVSSKMEWSGSSGFSSASPCSGTRITGLLAGDYYIRYQASGNTPPSDAARVTVPEGKIPAAPTGFTTVKSSRPGAADGSISGVDSTMEWSRSDSFGDAAACPNGTLSGLVAGTYYIRYKAVSATNTVASKPATVKVPEGVVPAAPSGLDTLQESKSGAKDGVIYNTKDTMEWSRTTDFAVAESCPNGNMTGLTAGIYYIRYKEVKATNTCAGNYATVVVERGKIPAAPTGLKAMQESKEGAKDGSISGLTTAMEWSTTDDFRKATACTGSTLTNLSAGTYFVRYKAIKASNICASDYIAVVVPEGEIPAAPTGFTTLQSSRPGAKDGKIMGLTTAMEWSTTDDFRNATPCTGSELTGLAAGTYYIRYKAISATHTAESNHAAVTVPEGQIPAAPTGLNALQESKDGAKDGKITGLTTVMEWSTTEDFKTATACTGTELTGLAAGTYYVRYQAVAATNTCAGTPALIVVQKGEIPPAPTGFTTLKSSAPGAKDGKIGGLTTAMEWSTTEDFKTATACTGSELTGLAAGTYYIRYKAVSATNTVASNYAAVLVPEGIVPAAPTGLSVLQESKQGAKDGKIMGLTTAMEWSTTADFKTATACTGSELTGLTAGTYYVRYQAVAATNTCAGTALALVVPQGDIPAAPKGLVSVPTSAPGMEDGRIDGTTSKMEWSLTSDFKKATRCSNGSTLNLAADTYYVRYRADAAANTAAGMYAIVTVEEGAAEEEIALFADVPANAYYADAVIWAVENGVTTGTSQDSFSPESSCDRAQVVTFLWRAAGCPKPVGNANPFTDVKSGTYYYDAVLWAVENGITQGLNATTFGTNSTVTRGQFVTFLCRSQKGTPSSRNTAFTDVPEAEYYADAVAWAVENGVTTGLTATSFAPNSTCNRGQVVTFLYRCFVK